MVSRYRLIKLESTGHRGFTIVELVIVMLILSVVMTAVMSLLLPAQRSSIVQSDLSTIQGSMSVALDRMSKDFRNAGFLSTLAPVASGGYPVNTTANETVIVDASVNPITINTRAVSGIFGRVDTIPATASDSFQLVYNGQGNYFPVDSYAVVIEPVNGVLIGDDGDGSVDGIPGRVFRVTASTSNSVKLGKQDGSALNSGTVAEFGSSAAGLILLRVPSDDIATIVSAADKVDEAENSINRTIIYAHEDIDGDGTAETLTRQVDGGKKSYIATGITSATFTIVEDSDGDANTVTIDLVGESVAAGNDTVGSAKTKRGQITLALRNI